MNKKEQKDKNMRSSRPFSPPRTFIHPHAVPFEDAQEAWFWFIQAMGARQEGARITAGKALVPRPCEPLDILKAVDHLVRQRRLQRDHILVLRHYGVRVLAPDPRRAKEARAYKIWREALDRLSDILCLKGIVRLETPDHVSGIAAE